MENATEDYRDIFYFEALYIRGKNIENIDVLLELPELKVLFYEAENEEQEEILQELSDRGCRGDRSGKKKDDEETERWYIGCEKIRALMSVMNYGMRLLRPLINDFLRKMAKFRYQ